jgi:NADH-quinone oxidoreductase subunit J
MVEFWPFAIVGALAVAAAVLMLLSENAVHSALFLIVTMGCIAFLFLLLNAPFLAMIQLTVYAGAIMVLVLFVIMLLGAERVIPADPGEGKSRMRWFTPVAVILAVALLFVIGTPLLVGDGDEPPVAQPVVRVLNVAPDAGIIDVYAGDELIASGLEFGDASPVVELPAGDHVISVVHGEPGEAADQGTTTFTLEPNSAQTIVAYGTGDQPVLSLVPEDMSSVPDRSARVTLFHANPEAPAVSLVDFGAEFVEDDTQVLLADLESGERAEPVILPEEEVDWAIVDAANNANVLYDMPDFEVQRDRSDLIVVAGQRVFDGSLRTVAVPVETPAEPAFGSPRAIGFELFTTYMLPFQLLAMLLLAAMVGVIVLTHRETDKSRRRATGRRRVSRPLTSVIAAQVGTDVSATNGSPAQLPDADTVGK